LRRKEDVAAARSLAAQVCAGAGSVNGWAAVDAAPWGVIDAALPWGGMKSRGIDRELGWSGIVANPEEVVTVVLRPSIPYR
jgi:acyl-CoA reductase-like NAD-dependent aldehyde dehydrogenase